MSTVMLKVSVTVCLKLTSCKHFDLLNVFSMSKTVFDHLFLSRYEVAPRSDSEDSEEEEEEEVGSSAGMFETVYVFTAPITDLLSDRRKRRSLNHPLLQWKRRRRSQTLTVKTCLRWTSDTSSSEYIGKCLMSALATVPG